MPTLTPQGMTPRYRAFRGLVKLLARLSVGFELEGEELVPRSGPVIFAANHRRFYDPVLVCMSVPRRVQWMAKKELFLKPVRFFFSLVGAFPVDRQSGGRAALRTALNLLSEGWALGIFPEGTRRRSVNGRFVAAGDEVKGGAVMMAVRSGAPIVPIYIDSVPTPLARLRGERLRAYIGEPIYLDAATRGKEAYSAASRAMIEAMYALPEKRTPTKKTTKGSS